MIENKINTKQFLKTKTMQTELLNYEVKHILVDRHRIAFIICNKTAQLKIQNLFQTHQVQSRPSPLSRKCFKTVQEAKGIIDLLNPKTLESNFLHFDNSS